MPIELICHGCGSRLGLQDHIGGDRLICPRCNARLIDPTAMPEELPPLPPLPVVDADPERGTWLAIVLFILLPVAVAVGVFLIYACAAPIRE